jgi:3-oxoacyl-[acyl-carrier-protein] synthase-3
MSMVRLSACVAALGDRRAIDDLPLALDDRSRLKSHGLERYADAAGETIASLSARAAAASLSAARLDPAEVDAVVLCTSSYWHADQLTPRSLGAFMCEARLTHGHLVQTSVQGCHNALTGLRLARNLLLAESLRHVLVVTCDIARDDASRLSPGPCVLGDGAAGCLVSREGAGDFQIQDLLQTDDHAFGTQPDTAQTHALRQVQWLRGIQAVAHRLLDRNRLRPSDVRGLVINNYNRSVCDALANGLGVAADRVAPFDANMGHVWSSDILVGLQRLTGQQSLDAGAPVLLLAAGPHQFGAALLRRH